MLARAQRGALGEGTSVSLAPIVGDALASRGEAISAIRARVDAHIHYSFEQDAVGTQVTGPRC